MDKKARREIVFLLGLFLVLVIPLAIWTWFKSDSSPFKSLRGGDSPWQISNTSWQNPTIALSPNGLYLAALCPTPPSQSAAGVPNTTLQSGNGQSSGSRSSDLVIWRVNDRSELARQTLGENPGNAIQWAGDGKSLAIVSRDSKFFAWSSNNTLLPAPRKNYVSSYSSSPGNSQLMETRLNLNSDYELVARYNGEVQANQISSGKPLPIVWRWTNDTRDDSGFGVDFIPQPGIPGEPVRAMIIESDYRLRHLSEKSKPVTVAPPIPKPKPQPKLSAEQKAFLEKEKRMNTEVEDVVNKLMSDEGELSDAEKAQLEARANELNAQIRVERNRVFPPEPPPKAPPQKPKWAQISFWDLSGNHLLWRKKVREGFGTQVSWSPDGKLLAILGVAQLVKGSNEGGGQSNGIEICDGLTGKTISTAARNDSGSFDEKNGVFWIDGPQLVVRDTSVEQRSRNILRFIDPSSGTTTQLLQFPETMKSTNVISTDAAGTTWIFATGQDGWRAFSISELQGASGSG